MEWMQVGDCLIHGALDVAVRRTEGMVKETRQKQKQKQKKKKKSRKCKEHEQVVITSSCLGRVEPWRDIGLDMIMLTLTLSGR